MLPPVEFNQRTVAPDNQMRAFQRLVSYFNFFNSLIIVFVENRFDSIFEQARSANRKVLRNLRE